MFAYRRVVRRPSILREMDSGETESLLLGSQLAKLEVGDSTFIHNLSTDILHRIFTLLLPIPSRFSQPLPGDTASASEFFKCTAPYNITHVCRLWKEFVLSIGSLRSEFSFSFKNPAKRTIMKTIVVVSRHLRLSQNLPLTCFVWFKGTFDVGYEGQIVNHIVRHQKRWRRVHMWFDMEPRIEPDYDGYLSDNDEYQVYIPWDVPCLCVAPRLSTEVLGQLEELSINYAGQYCISAASDDSEPAPLLLLNHLTLEIVEDYDNLARWLKLAPNVEELNLAFYSDHLLDELPSSHGSFPMLDFTSLHAIRVQDTLYSGVSNMREDSNLTSPANMSGFVIRFLTCPALTELKLALNNEDFEQHLHRLFLRSVPPLQNLDLRFIPICYL